MRRSELPNIARGKAQSHNNIVRAINGLADYSNYKRRLLSGLRVGGEDTLPLSKRSEGRKVKEEASPSNMMHMHSHNRSSTLSKVDLVMPEISPSQKRAATNKYLRYQRRFDQPREQYSNQSNPFKVMVLLENLYDVREAKQRQLLPQNQRRSSHIMAMRRQRSKHLHDPFSIMMQTRTQQRQQNQSQQLARSEGGDTNLSIKQKTEPPTIQHTPDGKRQTLNHFVTAATLQQQDLRPWATAVEQHYPQADDFQ